MKTRSKFSLAAALAMTAFVGTGYALWTFSQDATVDTTGNVSITAKAPEVGTLTVDAGQTFVLVLDQDGVAWQTEATEELDASKAVSVINLTYSGSKAEDYAGNYAVNENIEVTMTADYGTTKLADYVTFGNVADAQTVNYVGDDIAYEFALPTVSYNETNYPRNEEAYDQMVADIGSPTITFTFTAEVNECTHA